MTDLYFGKVDTRYLLYLDPIEINLQELIKNSNSIYCNELIFDGLEENLIKNQIFTLPAFSDLVFNNPPIVELDVLIDGITQVQNVWWNDILMISDLDTIKSFIETNKKIIAPKSFFLFDTLTQNPNIYFTISDNHNSKTYIEPSEFIAFIKNSERYSDKASKLI